MIKIKNINLILLSILLNNNLNSMQLSDTEESKEIKLSNLLEKARQYIIYQMIASYIEPYINKIKSIDNIFDLYSLDVSQIKGIITKELMNLLLTSKALNASALATIEYSISQIKKIIENKEKELTDNIKSNYKSLDTEELNNNLKSILDKNDINRNNLEEAIRLIIAGANPDVQVKFGNTVLILASIRNNKYLVKLLLNKKANPDIKNEFGNTVLMWASIRNNKYLVKLLLKKGADINIKDNYGNTALTLAAKYGHKDIVELLLNKDANHNIKDLFGRTALMWAVKRNYIDIVELLLNKNTDINLKDIFDNTALMIAKELGYADIVKLIRVKSSQENNSSQK